jgi:hypothetical protein
MGKPVIVFCKMMRSYTFRCPTGISGLSKIWLRRESDFFNTIGPKRTSGAGQAMSGPEGLTDIPRTHRDFAL